MIAPLTNAILDFDDTDSTTPTESFGNQVRSAVALALRGDAPTYQVEDEESRTHLFIHLAIEEQPTHRGISGGDQEGLIPCRFFGVRSSRKRKGIGFEKRFSD